MKPKFDLFQILFLSLAVSVRGQAIFIYDQQSADENHLQEGGAGIQTSQPIGQTFTPILSSVGFIRLYLYNTGAQDATVHLDLLGNSITGPFLDSSSSVILPSAFAGYFNFFFSTPVMVTPGSNYCFQPIVDLNTVGVNKARYNYPNGTAFFTGSPDPYGSDLWFREGIVMPKISSIELTNGEPLLRFPTFSNQNYSVEYSPDLSSGSWSNLLGTNIQGNGQDIVLTDTNFTMSVNRFYRLKLVP